MYVCKKYAYIYTYTHTYAQYRAGAREMCVKNCKWLLIVNTNMYVKVYVKVYVFM